MITANYRIIEGESRLFISEEHNNESLYEALIKKRDITYNVNQIRKMVQERNVNDSLDTNFQILSLMYEVQKSIGIEKHTNLFK